MRVSRMFQDQSTYHLRFVGSTHEKSPFSQHRCRAETWFLRSGHSNFAAATRCMVGRLDMGDISESGLVEKRPW